MLSGTATAASLLVAAAGCGSSSGPAPSGSASSSSVLGRAFTAKVAQRCEAALVAKRAEPPFPFSEFNPTAPDLTKLPAIGRYETRGVEIFRTWLRQMRARGAPAKGNAQWNRLLRAIEDHTRIITEQRAASLRKDGKTFTRDYDEGNRAQDETVRAAAAAGVPVCATAAGA
jgi:hypothetical protein